MPCAISLDNFFHTCVQTFEGVQTVPVSVIASTIEWLHSCHFLATTVARN